MMKEDFVIYSPDKGQFAMYDYSSTLGWVFTDDIMEAFAASTENDAKKWIHGWTLPSGRVVRPADKKLEGCVVIKRKLIIEVEI